MGKKGGRVMKITQEKLNEIIMSHGKWLRNEDGWQRANLQGAYLQDADLQGADLPNGINDRVICGCWDDGNGNQLESFERRIKNIYGAEGRCPKRQYFAEYMAAIEFFRKMTVLAKEEQ